MRWVSDPLKDRVDEVRIIKKFLWFPKCINKEWRWFESATIKQTVQGWSGEWRRYGHYWIDTDWVD